MNKNIIFMINIVHNERSKNQGYEWSIKSWKIYADKYNCDLFILDQPLFDISYMKPNWYKMYILDILEENHIEYDQVLFVDSDTIITDNAPNIFDITDHKFCAVRNFGDIDWIFRSIETYSKFLFNNFTYPFYNYFNSGLLVFNKKHIKLFKSIQKFYEENKEQIIFIQNNYGVGHDQPIFNFFVNRDISNDFKILGYEWNMQDLNRSELLGEDLLYLQYGYVCHFNSGIKPTPGYWLEKTYKHIYEKN